MSISQMLCEVRDRDYGGEQKLMARAWGVTEPTLSRWIRRERIPSSISYDFLAARLGVSLADIHRACQIQRGETAA